MHHLLFQDLSKGKQEGEARTGVNSSRESSGRLTSAVTHLLAVARDGTAAAVTQLLAVARDGTAAAVTHLLAVARDGRAAALGRTAGIRLEGLGEARHECSEAGKLVVGGAAGAPPQR